MRLPRIPFAPTRRLALVVLLLAPIWLASGVAGGSAVAAVVLLALAAAVVADLLLTPGGDTLEVERRAPTTVGVGDSAGGEIVVRSHWPRAVRVALFDLPPAGVVRRWGSSGAAIDADVRDMARLADGAGSGDVGAGPPDGAAGGPPPQQHDTAAEAGGRHPHDASPIDRPPDPLRGERYTRLTSDADWHAAFTLTGRERGVWPLGPLALRVAGPLGLIVRTVRHDTDDTVTVAPSVTGVRRYRLLALQHRLRDAGVRTIRRRGAGTAFAGLREYAVGDDPRHLDWKATARRGTLVTREFTVEQGQTVIIAIDAGRLMTQTAGPMARFEYALSSALVLADVAGASGDRVGLLVFDDEVRAYVPPARGRAALQQLRDALIPVQATLAEPDYAGAFRTLAARQRTRALLVLFTDVIDVRASQSLIAHTTRGAARHLPLVVALRNDALEAAAVPSGASTGAVYTAAAAEELLTARAEGLARMRQGGASVVDVSPHAMTAAVVNRYLEVKGRGAL